jgi:hypothetical protein
MAIGSALADVILSQHRDLAVMRIGWWVHALTLVHPSRAAKSGYRDSAFVRDTDEMLGVARCVAHTARRALSASSTAHMEI